MNSGSDVSRSDSASTSSSGGLTPLTGGLSSSIVGSADNGSGAGPSSSGMSMESIKEAVDAVIPENVGVHGKAEAAEDSTAAEAAVDGGQEGGSSVTNGDRDPRGNALRRYSLSLAQYTADRFEATEEAYQTQEDIAPPKSSRRQK